MAWWGSGRVEIRGGVFRWECICTKVSSEGAEGFRREDSGRGDGVYIDLSCYSSEEMSLSLSAALLLVQTDNREIEAWNLRYQRGP